MNYNKIDEMPEYTLAYGAKNKWGLISFALLVKNELSDVGYDAYIMENIANDIDMTVSELEKKFYNDQENFNIPSFIFKLIKSQKKLILNNHVRLFYNEEHMTPFESKMFELLKKSYFYSNRSNEQILLSPGRMGIGKDSRVFLYLGEINNFTIRMEDVVSQAYASNGKEASPLYRIEHEYYNELTERKEICYIDEVKNDYHHIYVEINSSYLNSEIFDFNYDISHITWHELRRMFVNVQVTKERKEITAAYRGSINTEVWGNSELNILFEGLIKGSVFNGNWWETIHEIFEIDKTAKYASFIEAKKKVKMNDGTIQFEDIKLRKYETGFRRIKIVKNMEEGE